MKNLEMLRADLASQCLQRGLVDEVSVYLVPVLLGDGVRSDPRLGRIDLEPFSNTQSGPVTCSGSASAIARAAHDDDRSGARAGGG